MNPTPGSLIPPDSLAIQTLGLRKLFGPKVAVKDLTLEVRQGEVFGFLGPNGAGKSTSVKMLLGLVKPSGGQAMVLGVPAGRVEARRKIGFLPEHFRFYDWLTPRELLYLHGRLYGMPDAQLRKRAPELLEMVGLAPHRHRRLRDFSKGMLQRIGLAQALLNDPDLIILDEPTSGLDPGGRRLVRDVIKAQQSRGATVFLNSHLLSEVEITCDRVAFIKHGEVLETRRLDSAHDARTGFRICARNFTPETLAGLAEWASDVRWESEHITFTVASQAVVPGILRYLVAKGVDIYEVAPQRLSLEDLFLKIVGPDGGL